MSSINVKTLPLTNSEDLSVFINEFEKAIKEHKKGRVLDCVTVWNESAFDINIIIRLHQQDCEENGEENKFIKFLNDNINSINSMSEDFLNKLKDSNSAFERKIYEISKNKRKDLLKEYNYFDFKKRISSVEESIIELYEDVKTNMKSKIVEEFAWVETYVKNCLDGEDEIYLKQKLNQIGESEENNLVLFEEISSHLKNKINKNVEQLGITDSSKQKYKVFDSKGNYTAMTGSGRPDVILRKNDGGIAFTYANHFQNTNMEGDQAERHSGIILETEYRYQQNQSQPDRKGIKWGEIFNTVNLEYPGIEGQRKNYKRINDLSKGKKTKEELEAYLDYQKYGHKMTISSYQNLDSSANKIKNMIIDYIKEMTGEEVTEEDERVQQMIAVHQGIMIMAQDFNNGIYSIQEEDDDMVSLEGSKLFNNDNIKIDGPSMRNPFSRKELYEEIRTNFLDPKIIEDSLCLLEYVKVSENKLNYEEDRLTFNNTMNLLQEGKTTSSKNGFSVKKEDLKNIGDENIQMYSLYMLFSINSLAEEQMKGVFESIVHRIVERVNELTEKSEELKVKANDVRRLVEEIQSITGKNTKDKLNAMLELITAWADLEVSEEKLQVSEEKRKVSEEKRKVSEEKLKKLEVLEKATSLAMKFMALKEEGSNDFFDEVIKNTGLIKNIIDKYEELKMLEQKKDFTIKLTKYVLQLTEEKVEDFLESIKNDIEIIEMLIQVLKNFKGEKKFLQDSLDKIKKEYKENLSTQQKQELVNKSTKNLS